MRQSVPEGHSVPARGAHLWHSGPAGALAVLLASGSLASCAGKRIQPAAAAPALIVLMPEEDGSASTARVSNPLGAVELDAPLEATRVTSNKPPTPPVVMDRADVEREFGAVLAGLPPPAEHFNLYFRTDTAELNDESRAMLPGILRSVSRRPAPEVTVIGHTDTTGSSANNYRLGLERAATIRKLLTAAGLDAAAIEIESHGEADLLVRTRNSTAEPRNRRVEITVR
jgi:outer membrane protein OmpA-like peptidoglycan-associated protein